MADRAAPRAGTDGTEAPPDRGALRPDRGTVLVTMSAPPHLRYQRPLGPAGAEPAGTAAAAPPAAEARARAVLTERHRSARLPRPLLYAWHAAPGAGRGGAPAWDLARVITTSLTPLRGGGAPSRATALASLARLRSTEDDAAAVRRRIVGHLRAHHARWPTLAVLEADGLTVDGYIARMMRADAGATR